MAYTGYTYMSVCFRVCHVRLEFSPAPKPPGPQVAAGALSQELEFISAEGPVLVLQGRRPKDGKR
jgi:hypothetical protein